MYCTTCGKELPNGSSVCDECKTEYTPDGKPLKRESTSEEHRPYMNYQPFSYQNDNNNENSGQNFEGQYSYGQQKAYERRNPYDRQNFNGYNNSQEMPEGHTGLAIAGFVLGIIGICSCCVPIISIPLGIIGLILSILGIKSRYQGLAIAGVVLSSISIVLGILMILAIIVSDDSYIHYYWNIID